MPAMTEVTCANRTCKTKFQARTADVKRGWGKFCSKSCKAQKQTRETDISGPDFRAAGRNVNQMRNDSYAKSKFKSRRRGGGGQTPWAAAGVSKETFLYYAEEYGGTPLFNRRGEYEGFIPTPFDNTQHQNSDPND